MGLYNELSVGDGDLISESNEDETRNFACPIPQNMRNAMKARRCRKVGYFNM